jgi:hypothetical protein
MPPPPTLTRRAALAPFVGEWVRCRGVAMRDSAGRRQSTLVTHLAADLGAGWVSVAPHAWVDGRRLCRDHGAGALLEFTAIVRRYEGRDPFTGDTAARHGLDWVRDVTSRGPAELQEMLGDLIRVFGWDAVADGLAVLHGEGGADGTV